MALARLDSNEKPSTAYYAFEETRDPETGMSPIKRVMSWAYLYSDQSASSIPIHVPPGTIVTNLIHQVTAALTGVTDILIGDSDAANNWITTGIITPTTAGDTVGDPAAVNPALGCKYYQTGDTIDLAFTGIATAGSGKVFIEVISYAEDLTDT